MNSEEEQAQIDGLEDDDLHNFIDEERESAEEELQNYLTSVEAQNDALVENDFKGFLSLFKKNGVKVDHKLSKEIFQKESYKSSSFPSDVAAIVKMDLPELTSLLSDLKNSIMGMRIKVATIIDFLKDSGADLGDSISLINLRMEVFTDYWTYLCLLVLKKVDITYSVERREHR